jgi:hypothetical protein
MVQKILACITALMVLSACGEKGGQEPNLPAPPESRQRHPTVPAASALKSEAREGSEAYNTPPRIVSVYFATSAIHRGVDIELTPHAEDADGDPIWFEYAWYVNGERLGFMDGPVLPGDRFSRGDWILVEVVPYDGTDYGQPFPAAEFVIPNAPPYFITTPEAVYDENGYTYHAGAKDPDEDPLTYYLESGPPGMAIDSVSGRVFWPIGDMIEGEHRVRIGAHDPEGMSALQEFNLNIAIQ